MTRIYVIIIALLLALPTLAEPADTFATAIRGRIDALLQNDIFDRTQLGLYVYDLTDATPLYDHGSRQSMRPASCEKVLTAAAALTYLGTDYCYKTRLYVADTLHLAIKGGMDPLFGKDDMQAFVQAIKEYGLCNIATDIICDASFKDTTRLGWGWCWDDAAVPLTPFLYNGRDTFETHLRSALREAGIDFSGQLVEGPVPQGANLLCTRSHTIDQVLQPMMKKSNNLYAETLFYQLAAMGGKPWASRRDAASRVEQYIDLCGHVIAHHQIADGSGLSLYNYVTPALLVDALRQVWQNPDVYAHLYPSLPVMGRDGTLSKRCCGTSAQDRVSAKTGTVAGVSSLAGYALAPNGHMLAFAIINQGIRYTSTGRNFQDRICRALTQPLGTADPEPDEMASPAAADSDTPEDGTAPPAETPAAPDMAGAASPTSAATSAAGPSTAE